jgi:hypothetical protein
VCTETNNQREFVTLGTMRIINLFVLLSLLLVGGVANADRWDSRGWTKLGEQTVNGRVDRDTIRVGRHEGRFSKITLKVEGSDMELLDMDIRFANGTTWSPRVKHYFRENSRTRVIDLPGDERVIQTISLKYRNIRGGGRARVEVWGFKTDNRRRDDDGRRGRDRRGRY